MTETISEKNVFDVPFANMEGAGFVIYTAARHQGAIEMIWLHFWGAVMSSIFICSLWFVHFPWEVCHSASIFLDRLHDDSQWWHVCFLQPDRDLTYSQKGPPWRTCSTILCWFHLFQKIINGSLDIFKCLWVCLAACLGARASTTLMYINISNVLPHLLPSKNMNKAPFIWLQQWLECMSAHSFKCCCQGCCWTISLNLLAWQR